MEASGAELRAALDEAREEHARQCADAQEQFEQKFAHVRTENLRLASEYEIGTSEMQAAQASDARSRSEANVWQRELDRMYDEQVAASAEIENLQTRLER